MKFRNALGLFFAACLMFAQPAAATSAPTNTQQPSSKAGGGKTMIAYFSRSGNTEKIAHFIAEETGAELFKIEMTVPCPDNYNQCITIAKQQQNENARPELSTHVEDMDQYDTIFLGFPNWWGTMPMALFTFLEEYNFTGKTIIPFNTHGGSGFGRSLRDLAAEVPDATILEGLSVRGESAAEAEDAVTNWLKKIGMIK